MKYPTRLDYAYAVGRVRALEKGLISQSDFHEAAEEKDLAAALKVLYDAGAYDEELVGVRNSRELDACLERVESGTFDLVKKLMPDDRLYPLAVHKGSPEDLYPLAMQSDFPFMADYYRHRIDLGNMKIFSRIKYLDLGKERLEKSLLAGGFFDGGVFLDALDLSWSEVGEKIRSTPYFDLWARGTDRLEEEETFAVLERESEDFLMRFLKRAKYIVFGPEPVFAFAVAKRQEIRMIRLVGIGKINGIPETILKERLGETYV